MVVGWKATDDDDVSMIGHRRAVWMLDRLCDRVLERLSLQYCFYPSSILLPRRPWFREADVIQLCNTHGGYFSHLALPALCRARPVVWRLDDMWPMTGHCIYSFDCTRWKTGCGSCPIVADYPSLRRDRTALLWRLKRRAYRRASLTLVAPSRWMAGLTRESPLLDRFPIHVIPNGLDVQVFRPIPRSSAREVLGLDPRKRVVLFGSHMASDRRKGAGLLAEALARLAPPSRKDVELLTIGRGSPGWDASIPLPVRHLGPIRDDALLATIYSAADVYVLPTLADNLPNTLIESMACGTPVVSFDVGGVAEAVRHLETGYLAKARDVEDFTRGMALLLDDPALRAAMGRRGREVVEQDYTLELQARRFLEVYREAIERH
jgi:glycosyltransferase involved in cell wall biosynthesis